jgi:hypothetical protein
MIARPQGGPSYATVRGLTRLAGTEPQAYETGLMEHTDLLAGYSVKADLDRSGGGQALSRPLA